MAKQVTLSVEVRDGLGKEKVKKMRNAGEVPAEFYGKGAENLHLKFNEKEFIQALKGAEAGIRSIFQLKIKDGDKEREEMVYVPDYQRDPIKDNYVHIDFMKINVKEAISSRVPVKLIGESPAIKAGFVLAQPLHYLPIQCLPLEIPVCIEIDVSVLLEAHDSVRVGDVKLEGISIELPDGQQIVHAEVPREMKVESDDPDAAAVAEEPAEGDEAAADGDDKAPKEESKEESKTEEKSG